MISDDELKWCTEQYADMILRVANSYFGSIDDAQDIVQEVFIRLMQHNKTFADEEHRKRLLICVAANICRNERKSVYRRRAVLLDNNSTEITGISSSNQNEYRDEAKACGQRSPHCRIISV